MNIRQTAAIVSLSVLNAVPLSVHAGVDAYFVPNEVRVSDPEARITCFAPGNRPAPRTIIDPEIDSLGNQFCWSTRGCGDPSAALGELALLWVGNIDPETGDFDPPDGEGLPAPIDTRVVPVGFLGNGPEWVFTDVGPQIIYTTEIETEDGVRALALKRAFRQDGEWQTSVLLGADGTFSGGAGMKAPIGSTDRGDTTPMISYQGPANAAGIEPIYVRVLDEPTTERQIPYTDVIRTPGGRWAEGENTVILTLPMDDPDVFPEYDGPPRQIWAYNADTEEMDQLTNDAGNKIAAFAFNAPEYDNEQVLLALVGETKLALYRDFTDQLPPGVLKYWTLVQVFEPPSGKRPCDPYPYIWSPEPFVYEGKTYISMTTAPTDDQQSLTQPTEVWMVDLDPDEPLWRKLSGERLVNRKDPETYIGENGPYVIVNIADGLVPPPDVELCPAVGGDPDNRICAPAIYRLDTGLGSQEQACPPTGCAGPYPGLDGSPRCGSGFSGWRVILLKDNQDESESPEQ